MVVCRHRERGRKVAVVVVVASLLLIGGAVAYWWLTSHEVIVDTRGVAPANDFIGYAFTVPQSKISGEGRLVDIQLTLDDARGYIMWYFFVCNTPHCVSIGSDGGTFSLRDGTAYEMANQSGASSLAWEVYALNKGTDRYYFFMFSQTVDYVATTGYHLRIEMV